MLEGCVRHDRVGWSWCSGGGMMKTLEDALNYEELTMGRPVTLVDWWRHAPSDTLVVIYDCDESEDRVTYQRRIAVYVGDNPKTSAIVASGFGTPPWAEAVA